MIKIDKIISNHIKSASSAFNFTKHESTGNNRLYYGGRSHPVFDIQIFKARFFREEKR